MVVGHSMDDLVLLWGDWVTLMVIIIMVSRTLNPEKQT